MAERKPLSKKTRFEVFKRDKFTCQYCGRSVPDVILQVDHIKPVAKGGKNDLMNLVTSCRDCNLGKGARELSDDSVVKKQQQRIEELADKNEQLEMFLRWRNDIQSIEDKEVEAVNGLLASLSEWSANDKGKRTIRKWIKEFSIQLVMDATEIAFDQYYRGTSESWNYAFDKIGGICRNKQTDKQDRRRYYCNYIKKGCRGKFNYHDPAWIESLIYRCAEDEDDFECIKDILKSSRNWTVFKERLIGIYGDF